MDGWDGSYILMNKTLRYPGADLEIIGRGFFTTANGLRLLLYLIVYESIPSTVSNIGSFMDNF